MSKALRHKIYETLEMGGYGNRLGALFDWFMVGLILVNVMAVAAQTVPSLNESYAPQFYYFELFSVVIFSVEYLARLWVCVDNFKDSGQSALGIRMRYFFSPLALIDLLAIAPFYLIMFGMPDLRILRVFRLIRLLKLVRYSPAIMTMGRVIYDERRALIGALIIMIGLLFFASTLAYFAENEAQPENFKSIPHSLWWAIATLTTVGYGDVVPITLMGKIVGGVVMVFGLGFYAIPIGIVASAFSSEIHRRDFVVRYGLVAGVPLFEGLGPETINEISRLLRTLTVEKGAIISHKGQIADGMYFLVSGEATAHVEGRTVPIHAGGFFGEISLLKTTFREVTVIAETSCKLMVLETNDFQHLMLVRPELKKRLGILVQGHLKDYVNDGVLTPTEQKEIMMSHKKWID